MKPRKLVRRLARNLRATRKVAWALAHRHHPLLAHLIPVRRCNLACAYCNEYDAVSAPVPLDTMLARVDKLADLGTAMITISGGEPLLHPQLEQIIARQRRRGMLASVITNGYLLSRERIEALNEAGLDYLQISIDNVEPDHVSMKSLRLLEPKLKWLSELAAFHVNINSVLGAGVRNPDDALVVARRARELGFNSSVGVIHDGHGQLRALGGREMEVYREIKRFGTRGDVRVNALFQDNLVLGRPNAWRCRAGSRFLYVDENGLVSYCSQMRGFPGVPLEKYSKADLVREYDARKSCAPYCTISCVQRVAVFDNWRGAQRGEAAFERAPARVLDDLLVPVGDSVASPEADDPLLAR
jgi:MoaA/NifB/PqqE/SkfB family radical SAM enzyme